MGDKPEASDIITSTKKRVCLAFFLATGARVNHGRGSERLSVREEDTALVRGELAALRDGGNKVNISPLVRFRVSSLP